MNRAKKVCEDLAERLELPEEAALNAAKLTLTGGKRALVENHRGLLEYSTEQITVRIGRGRIILRGSDLTVAAMNRKELLVCGRITSAEWE